MSAVIERESLRQRADYTHKYNTKTGRHGWLRLTPAYSLKIVEELVTNHDGARRVFDPFCGTGTTALSAAYHGHEGVTTDINPFLIWFAQAKMARYSPAEIKSTQDACERAIDLVKRKAVEPVDAPPIHKIERWWHPKALEFLRLLRAAIAEVTPVGSPGRSLAPRPAGTPTRSRRSRPWSRNRRSCPKATMPGSGSIICCCGSGRRCRSTTSCPRRRTAHRVIPPDKASMR